MQEILQRVGSEAGVTSKKLVEGGDVKATEEDESASGLAGDQRSSALARSLDVQKTDTDAAEAETEAEETDAETRARAETQAEARADAEEAAAEAETSADAEEAAAVSAAVVSCKLLARLAPLAASLWQV